MKRIIGIVLSFAMLTVHIPAALAADIVTAADVQNILAASSLINNEYDYNLYNEGLAKADKLSTEIEEYLNPNIAYHFYAIKYNLKDKLEEFVGNVKQTDIKSSLLGEYNRDEAAYVYKNRTNDYEFGHIYLGEDMQGAVLGWDRQTITLDASFLLFDYEALARIINENNLDNVTEIILFENNLYDYSPRNALDYNHILLETADGEYVVTDIQYDTDTSELLYYTLLDSEAFTDALLGDYDKAREIGYNSLNVENPPVFSDIQNEKSVDLLARLRIISGYEDGTFRPENSITRAETAKILATMSQIPKIMMAAEYTCDDTINYFSDIDKSHWAYSYIQHGYFQGYINGKESMGQKQISAYMGLKQNENGEWVKDYQDKTIDTYAFCPDDLVTELELVKMLVSVTDIFGDKMAGAEGGYPDGYVSVAKRLGICETASDKPATRLTAARMIKKSLDAEVNSEISHRAIFPRNNNGGMPKTAETVYGKEIRYNTCFSEKQIRLTGKITGTLRGNEYSFIVDKDIHLYSPDFKAGEKISLLSQYGDLDEYVGKDCTVYCTHRGGNLVVIMAE